jgi:dipeptidyl aminopeptidase/acylaminoacyl peptidase
MAKGIRPFEVKDVFRHRALSALTVTPDGHLAAFVAAQPDLKGNKGRTEIWAWSRDGGTCQVTFGGEAGQPQFSPQGDRLAFVSNRDDGKSQLYVMGVRLSEGRKVTSFEHGVVKFAWRPDGRRIAVVAQPDRTPEEKERDEEKHDWWAADADERRRALWVINADGHGDPQRMSADGEHVSSAAWTPDGKRLVYTACPVASINSQWFESDLKIVDRRGKRRRTACPVRGQFVESPIYVSPDGQRVLLTAARGGRDPFFDVAKVISLSSGDSRLVHPRTDLRSVLPKWLPDGRVLFEAGLGTRNGLFVCEVGGTPRLLDTGAAVSAQAAIAGEAGLAFYVGSATHEPDEVYARPLDGSGEPAKLTNVNRTMAAVNLASSEVVTWKSEGADVEGVLYLPTKPGARRPCPLVLMPHGGPYGASMTGYSDAVVPNVFCAAGYACLQPNFRGSTGYGRPFLRRIVGDWGDGPFRDIMAGVDSLIRRGVVDGKRMAVFGSSYGGYVTAWIVGHTTRFACAIAVAAVTDNVSMWGTTDIPDFMLRSSGRAKLSFADDYWREQSPLSHIRKARTPTLVITGEKDVRVPPSQSYEFYRALKAHGVETKLVLYPREPHGIAEPRHREHFLRTALSYINDHVMGRQ